MRALRKKMTMGGGLLLAFCLATVLGFAYTLTSPTSSLAEEPAAAGKSATSASWADAVVEAAEGQLDAVVDPSEGWDVQFVSDCLSAAGVEGMPDADDAQAWLDALQQSEDELYAAPADHEPAAGDIVFFAGDEKDADGQALAGTMGIVSEVTPATDDAPAQIVVIEAHEDGAVVSNTYPVDDEGILGYGLLPEQPVETVTAPEESEGEKNEGTVALDNTLTYEAEDYTVAVKVSGEATVADGSEPAPESDGLTMNTTALDASAPAYQAAEAYVEDSDPESVISVSALEFEFVYNGQALDVSDCEVTAGVTPSDKLQEAANAIETDEDTSDEAEVGVALTALQSTEGSEAEELDTVLVEKDATERPTMTLALNAAAPALQLVARDALNPHFTVQYYANLEVAKTTTAGPPTVVDPQQDASPVLIDTDNGGKNQGGKLPTNGGGTAEKEKYNDQGVQTSPRNPNTTLTTKRLTLEGDGTRSSIATEKKLTLLYEENEYDYFSAPSLHYFNVLEKNGNYKLSEIWVLKDGKNADSTNRDDWDVYTDLDNLHFTNSESSAGSNTIAIDNDMVIRLVAETTDGAYNNAATFYDYDITDSKNDSGYGITWDTTNGSHGINSSSNYTGLGSKLAFGNANTGMGLEGVTWNTHTLNQYNHSGNSFQGATFGLVEKLDDNGNIVYSDGVDAPKLFNDGTANGKTTYSGWSLDFNRSGDTYTLSAVNDTSSTVLDNLEYFNNPQTPGKNPYTHIWTNNFWPMDEHPGYDGLTGYYMDRGKWVGKGGNELYPTSDDGKAHNNMFGMQYQVKFELTEDYRGPLEYYFFGDDDMWVFLDGKLVCDIGGVHSSIGEYVNLWDYIAKGDSGEHTLTFYYTERGLSGSTCYMQFTLPSVSSVPITHDTGQLKIQKQVVGSADENLEFSFDVTLTDANGNALIDDYSIMRYATDGSTSADLIQGGKGSFKLKADEYVIIDYLPYGTKYTITETGESDGYTVSNQVDSAAVDYDVTAEGQIQEGQNGSVVFTNTFRPKLPDTGGPGALIFTLGGAAVIATAVTYGFHQRKRSSR